MTSYPPPSPQWAGPAAHDSGPGNIPATRVVIHSTVSPCREGERYNIAAYFRSEQAGGSAHYVTDPVGVVQVVGDHTIAWHAPPNAQSLGIEMCDMPGPVPDDKPGSALWKAARRAWRWRRPEQQAMLHVTAQLTAQLCLAYDIPPRFIGVRQLRKGAKGVTTHNKVSRTWHQSTHWDPGFWPRRHFMALVQGYYRQEKRDHAV